MVAAKWNRKHARKAESKKKNISANTLKSIFEIINKYESKKEKDSIKELTKYFKENNIMQQYYYGTALDTIEKERPWPAPWVALVGNFTDNKKKLLYL